MTLNKSIGLDIGLNEIKAMSLSRQNDNYILDSFSVMPSPSKGMLSESPADEEKMATAISKTIDGLKASTKNVNISLSDTQAYTKVIEMPVLSDKELSQAIYWEAERYIPVALSTITLVFNVLKRPLNSSAGEKMQILMVGAPTTIINKYQRILKMTKYVLSSVETETLAIVRALITPNLPLVIIVNIGEIGTSLMIVRDGILVFTYSMQVGGDAISRAIETDFGLTPDQVEEYKRTYGFSKKGEGQKVGRSTGPILTSILLEIKKTLAFYSQKYKDDSRIQQILLSGNTARLPGIDLFFAESLGIETVVVNPLEMLSNKPLPAEILNSPSDFTVALGLAMKDL